MTTLFYLPLLLRVPHRTTIDKQLQTNTVLFYIEQSETVLIEHSAYRSNLPDPKDKGFQGT